jgi:hypothetical protein
MGTDVLSELDLPMATRDALERFRGELEAALGERLVAVVLYGGIAKGEYAPLTSDVNAMVVLQDATTATLDQLVAPVQEGMRDCRLAVMVLTEEDLRHSTDVFPIKFLDMQRHHRVLCGRDVLADLDITDAHLRLRCEQEIKNLLLRLRQFYVQRQHRPELVEATLGRAVSSFLTDLGVVLLLKTGAAPVGKEAIAEAAARELGLDGQVLHEVLALKGGTRQPNADELKRLYDEFMRSVEQAAEIVDGL